VRHEREDVDLMYYFFELPYCSKREKKNQNSTVPRQCTFGPHLFSSQNW